MHVAAQTRRQAVGEHLDHATEGVTVTMGGGDLVLHGLSSRAVKTAHGAVVDRGEILRKRHGMPQRHRSRTDAHDVAEDLDAGHLPQEGSCDGGDRDARSRLAGTRALENRTRVGEPVLLHAGEVGVTGPGARQRRVAGEHSDLVGIDGIRAHHLLPLGPFRVRHLDGHRAAHRRSVADTAHDADLVALELHAGASTGAKSTTSEVDVNVGGGHGDAGGQSFGDRHQGGAMGLPCRQPAHHGPDPSRWAEHG